ncbi:MAG: DUF4388 domain-containing protein [Syntrophales bacterium]|nr:DUF4388 domain-containing protein [Syntrophales bacterium]HPL64021.1 DUF4388 domain-containing protein [Syntrophales bacterium]
MQATKTIKLIVDNAGDKRPPRPETKRPEEEPDHWPLAGLSLSSVLQVIAMDQQTCLVEVHKGAGGPAGGAFYFIAGELCDAECGDLDGEEAAMEMLSWKNPRFAMGLLPDAASVVNKIDRSLMLLLLESSRRGDEKETACSHAGEAPVNSAPGGQRDAEGAPDSFAARSGRLIESLKKDMGPALVSTAVTDIAGNVLSGWNADPEAARLFHELDSLFRQRNPGGSPLESVRYYLVDVERNRTIFSLLLEGHNWGTVFNNEKLKLGLFLHAIAPGMIRSFEDAVASGKKG